MFKSFFILVILTNIDIEYAGTFIIEQGLSSGKYIVSPYALYSAYVQAEYLSTQRTTNTAGDYIFGPNIRVNDDFGSVVNHETTPAGHAIAVLGDTIYIVWSDCRDYPSERWGDIYFAKSVDGGETFLPNVKVNHYSKYSQLSPSIRVDSFGIIYVAWSRYMGAPCQFNVYFAKSTDGGLNFSTELCVTDTCCHDGSPVGIAVSGGNVYLVWADMRNSSHYPDIYFDRSVDGGETFGNDIKINDSFDGIGSWAPSIDAHGNNVFVAWNASFDCIYFDKSTDAGVTFGTDVQVNDSDYLLRTFLGLAVDNNDVIHIVWTDLRNTPDLQSADIYYAKSTDGGSSFGTNLCVTEPPLSAWLNSTPNITVDLYGNPYCIWEDRREYTETQRLMRPYFAYSDDGGTSFSKNICVIDDDGLCGNQYFPTLAVDVAQNVYAVWSDSRNFPIFTFNIYFAKGTLTGIEEDKSQIPNSNLRLDVYPNPFSRRTTIDIRL
ncbi:MAG: sialidase family protein, partial [bacterium]|nr:sialidase family protein [bacterium]